MASEPSRQGNIEAAYADDATALQGFMDAGDFCASMRGSVTALEDGIFLSMRFSPGYRAAVQGGMLPVPHARDACRRLQAIRFARSIPKHPASLQFLQSPEALLEDVWAEALTASGVSQEHYQLLRAMKAKSSTRRHQPPTTIAGATQLLALPLPLHCSQYREPLAAAIAVLQSWRE